MALQQREVFVAEGVALEAPAVAAVGTITCGQIADGNTVTISDGAVAITFEFDDDDSVSSGNTPVEFATSGGTSAANLLTAINAAAIGITATATEPASATINLSNDTPGAAGNVTITKVGAPITVTGMAGGLDAVDLYTIQEALDDMTVTANPPAVTLTTASGTAASSGDNTLVAAPSAGNRIVVHDLQLQLEAATATTMLIKSGNTTRRRFYAGAAGDGLLLSYAPGKEFRLGAAEALVLNLSGANSVGYTVRYTTEAV